MHDPIIKIERKDRNRNHKDMLKVLNVVVQREAAVGWNSIPDTVVQHYVMWMA
jgi:hypothetical protein